MPKRHRISNRLFRVVVIKYGQCQPAVWRDSLKQRIACYDARYACVAMREMLGEPHLAGNAVTRDFVQRTLSERVTDLRDQ